MASSAYITEVAFCGLLNLECLRAISIQLTHVPYVSQNWIGQLKRYQFLIGDGQTTFWETEPEGKMVIINYHDLESVSTSRMLSNAFSLVIDHYPGGLGSKLKLIAWNRTDCFVALRSLTIANTSLFLPASTSNFCSSGNLLPNIEELHLINVSLLESISDLMDGLRVSLSKVREIEVNNCQSFEFLLRVSPNLELRNLQVIRVRFCTKMKMLIQHPDGEFLGRVSVVPNLLSLEVTDCKDLFSVPLGDLNSKSLEEIIGDSNWWSMLKDNIFTKKRLQHLFKPLSYAEH